MEWAERCAALVLAPCPAAKQKGSASVALAGPGGRSAAQRSTPYALRLSSGGLLAANEGAALACSARRRPGDRQPTSPISLPLPGVLAATVATTVSAARRHCSAQRARGAALPLPTGWFLAATTASGHTASGRRGTAQRAAMAALSVSQGRLLGYLPSVVWWARVQPAHFHALHSAADRRSNRRGERKRALQPHGIAER